MGPKRRTQSTEVNAVGRVLSEKNATAIKTGLESIATGHRNIGRVLVEAGVLAEADIKVEAAAAELAIEASSFTDAIATKKWFTQLQTTLRSFRWSYEDLHTCKLAYLPDEKTEAGRKASIAEAIDELEELLDDLASNLPTLDQPLYSYTSRYYDDDYYPMALAAKNGESDVEVAAGRLRDSVVRQVWSRTLQQMLEDFKRRFESLCCLPLGEIAFVPEKVGTEEERATAIAALVSDLIDLLREHSSEYPITAESNKFGIYAAAKERSRRSQAVPKFEAGQLITASRISLTSTVEVGEEIPIDEASLDELDLEIEVEAASGNLHPIEGSLFRIDEPSEAPPSVGPGLPLYIPRHVAEQVLDVANKPLEAAPTLTMHAKDKTIGVMASAEIRGNDFWFHGFLWPYNHSQQVAQISASKEMLGTSMNAMASGHVAEVDGQQVFWIDSLELMGGCILFADLATYQKTQVNAEAQRAQRTGAAKAGWAIAAAAAGSDLDFDLESESDLDLEADDLAPDDDRQPPPTTDANGEDDPMDPLVQSQFTAINASMEKIADTVQQQFQAFQQELSNIRQTVGVLQEDRQATIQARAQQQQIEAQAQQQKQLIEAIGTAVGKEIAAVKEDIPRLIEEKIAAAINPSRMKPRNTVPVVASATGGSAPATGDALMDVRLELARLDGELTTLEASPVYDGPKVMELLDRKRTLQMQLQQN